MRKSIVLICAYLFFVKCTPNEKGGDIKDIINKSYHTEYIYYDQSDSSSFIEINFDEQSGDTCKKMIYENGIIKSRVTLNKNGVRTHEEYSASNVETVKSRCDKKDSIIALINTLWSKKWDSKGRLIFESKLLPNRREQQIEMDSLGNIIRIDTISI